MADQDTPAERARNQLRQFREIISNVIGELRSQELRNTYGALTLPELMDQQLQALTGTGRRVPSRKERTQKLYDEFKANIAAIKATPPSAFRQHDPKNDVNTAP